MHKLFRYKNLFIAVFALLLGLSIYAAMGLRFYHDLDAFFPKGDPELEFLNNYKKELESDDLYVLVGIENDRSIFDTAFLGKLKSFTQDAARLPHMGSANSLATMADFIKTPLGFARTPLVHINDTARIRADSIRLYRDPRWVDNLFSRDARVAVAVLKMKGYVTEEHAEPIVHSLDSLISVYKFKETHLVSRAHAQVVFVKKSEEQLQFYIVVSMLVLTVIMALVFRRFLGVLIPVLSSVGGLILFMGFLAATGHKLSLMSTLYPVLVLTIGMSDIIHIMNKYIEEQMRGLSREAAMYITIKEIGLATLLTCVCTVIGFMASLTIPIEPIQEFSVNAAIGVVIAYLTVILFTSMILLHFDAKQLTQPRIQSRFWNRLVQWIYDAGLRFPKRIALVWVGVLLIAVWGISRVSTNTHLLDDVPRTDKLQKDFHFFEKFLSGARPFEMAILPKAPYTVDSIDVLKQTEKLTEYLESRQGFGKLVSPVTMYKSLNRTFHGGQLESYVLPETQEEINQYTNLLEDAGGEMLNTLISKDRAMGRVTGRMKDFGADSTQEQYKIISRWAEMNLDTSKVKFHITGTALVIDRNNEYLRVNLFQGLGLAFLLIAIVMAFLFRSVKMVLISLIPNIFPLLICGAIMGFAGIELKAATAIIFEIVFGIAVDDTIHFLTQYKLELARGRTSRQAIANTFHETGKAIILTSVILFSGFITLAFSAFTATYYIGILMSFTFVSAVLSDLFILPLLIRWAYGNTPVLEEEN